MFKNRECAAFLDAELSVWRIKDSILWVSKINPSAFPHQGLKSWFSATVADFLLSRLPAGVFPKPSTWVKRYFRCPDTQKSSLNGFQSSIVRQPDDQQALDKQTVHKATAAASHSSPIQETKPSSHRSNLFLLTNQLSLTPLLPLGCLFLVLIYSSDAHNKTLSNLMPREEHGCQFANTNKHVDTVSRDDDFCQSHA